MPPRATRAKNEGYRRSGTLIAKAREQKELTQQQLADQLKISRQRLEHWEAGAAMPRVTEMRKLATALDLTVDEIMRGERLPERPTPTVQQDLELTPDGRTVGRIWDDLPQAGKDYIAEQLAAMLRFQVEDRDMSAYVFQKPSADTMKRLKGHERLLEMVQDKSRRRTAKQRNEPLEE